MATVHGGHKELDMTERLTLSLPRDWFCGRQFFHRWGLEKDDFGMIQAHSIYYACYFYNY